MKVDELSDTVTVGTTMSQPNVGKTMSGRGATESMNSKEKHQQRSITEVAKNHTESHAGIG